MSRRTRVVGVVIGAALAACSGGGGGSGFGDGGTTGPTTGPAGQSTGSNGVIVESGGSTSGVLLTGNGGTSSTAGSDGTGPCPYTTGTVDHDGDGWSPADGDCNDCNKYINPGAYDIPGDGVDEDCDGKIDDAVTNCDSTLTNEATTAGTDGATAMDICKSTTASPPLPMKTWGLISAAYVLPDNSNSPHELQHDDVPCSYSEENFQLGFGILPKFGTSNTTQAGVKMLGLSSGTARNPGDTGYEPVWGFDKCYTSGAPNGFPGQTPACGDVQFGAPHDGAALQLVLRVPTNALTMSFDSNFFSFEFPEYVCSPFNDTFVVIMVPSPAGEPTTNHDNIEFDSMNNLVSVNAGFLQVCQATTTAGDDGTGTNAGHYSYTCPKGPSALDGTGFGADSPQPPSEYMEPQENHASTGWLTTTVSVANLAGQSITLLFAVWDSSDGILDTTVLVDNLTWTFATAPNQSPPATVTPPMTSPK